MTIEQIRAMRIILDAVVDAVKAAGPLGAPGGTIYAGLMSQGCSFDQYQQIMGALVTAGKVRRNGELYHAI